ncbi:MAG: hypothetical protein IE916_00175 [Epsilonproteobacteria bacterium]|nr:hypothetical protein [Campylobacterota bacterium]
MKQIHLVLEARKSGKVHSVSVDREEEIVSISVGDDGQGEHTIVYAFDSNLELFRLKGYFTQEEAAEIAFMRYKFYIFRSKRSFESFVKKAEKRILKRYGNVESVRTAA